MIRIFNRRPPSPKDNPCPSGEQLRRLIDGGLSAVEQAASIGHLDDCEACRGRLEQLAGAAEVGSRAALHLKADPLVPESELERLMSRVCSDTCWSHLPTRPVHSTASLAFLAPCDKPDRIGRLDRYEIIEVIGRGGMGVVFKALDPALDRLVAIKVLASPLAKDEKARERFRREAKAAAAVRSEHVVAIYSVEETAELPYLVMEYVQGRSLQGRIDADEPLDLEEIARIGYQAAVGLAAAHDKGLVHRDVKPANLLLEEATGAVKITDFGLACAVDEASVPRGWTVVGTPEYMAPEQADAEPVDHRADLFSLGSVLYAMCTGRSPFRAENALSVLRRIREERPAPISTTRPDLPAWLTELIEKLHRKDPADRFDSAAEVAEQIRQHAAEDGLSFAQPLPRPLHTARRAQRRRRRMVLAVVLLAGIAGLGISEVAGLTRLVPYAASLLGIGVPEGKLTVEVEQPGVEVRIESGGTEYVLSVPGPHELRVEPGDWRVTAIRAGKTILDEVIAVTREEDKLIRVRCQGMRAELFEHPSPYLVRRMEGHIGPVACVAVSPDGKLGLSGGGWPDGDRTIRLWDLETGEEIRRFQTSPLPPRKGTHGPLEVPGAVYGVAFSPDGRLAVSGSVGGFVRLWDVKTGKMIRNFDGHDATVYAVAFSHDGRRVVTGSRDHTMRLWDVQTGEEVRRFEGHTDSVRSVALSPDGKRALSGGADKTMRLWDVQSGSQLREFDGFDGWVDSVTFSPDGRRAACASKTIRVWDLEDGRPVLQIDGHLGDATCVTFSPDGRRLLSASYDTTVRLWDAATGRQIRRFVGHRNWVWSAAVSPDGRHALSGGGGRRTPQGDVKGTDFAVRLWELP